MCGRYTVTSPLDELLDYLGITLRGDILATTNLQPRYNIAPTQPVLIARNHPQKGERELVPVEWGLVPEWQKEKPSKPLINARLETILAKPSFRGPIRHHRCIIPANGFYEWQRSDATKQPYYIQLQDSPLMAFAGIWTTWYGPDGENMLETCAMITRAANEETKPIHHRMPMLLKSTQFDHWLNWGDMRVHHLLNSIEPSPEGTFSFTPVSSRVNNIRNDDTRLIEPELPTPPAQGSLF